MYLFRNFNNSRAGRVPAGDLFPSARWQTGAKIVICRFMANDKSNIYNAPKVTHTLAGSQAVRQLYSLTQSQLYGILNVQS